MSYGVIQIQVALELLVPVSLLANFKAYHKEAHHQSDWGLPRVMAFSIAVGSCGGEKDGRPKWTSRRNGVASAADRLKMVRRLLKTEESVLVEVPIPVGVWSEAEERARERGITRDEQYLVALAYHAALPAARARKKELSATRERKKAPGPPKASPFARFENSLKDDIRAADVENDEQPKRRKTFKRLEGAMR